jgi:hypothetical protein
MRMTPGVPTGMEGPPMDCGLTVHVTNEAVFLEFRASTGLVAWINVDRLATEQEIKVMEALEQWCEDRRMKVASGSQKQ